MKNLPSWAWALVVLVLILLFNIAFTPGFFNLEMRDGRLYGSLIDVVNRAVPVALLALGMTLVIATGGIDLSVGAVIAVTGAVAASLIAQPTESPLVSLYGVSSVPGILLISLAVALFCGLFNGALVTWLGLQPIIATLLLMVTGRGVAQLLANGQIVTFNRPEFSSLATGSFLALPAPVWIVLAVLGLISLLMRGTALGLFVEATGSNPVAAKHSGIRSDRVKLTVYAISGICAGIAGIIITGDIRAADANNAGLYYELDAIIAVAVGGTSLAGGRFSLVGSLIGALLMQAVTTTVLTRGVPPEITLVLKALIVVAVCLLQAPSFRELLPKMKKVAA